MAVSEDRRLEAEIGYLEKVQDGTIAYTTTSGFGPLLPADFPTIKKAVDRVVAKYGGFDFAKVRWQDATVISGWLKEIDHAIEQAGKLSRYSRDMRFDAAEQLKAEHTVAELNGFGGMLAIAGDFENADIFYSAAVRIYSETGQHVKAAEMEVQYASCLANKGLIEKAKHFFESAGRLYEIAAKAAETPVEKMLALELAGDMYRRGGKDLQARQMYEEAVVVEAKPGKDDSRLPEHRRRIVEKLTVINEKLVLQMIMTDLDRIYLNFDGLSPNERQRTAERCLKDWNRLSEAEQMGWREIGKGGAFIKGPGYVSERYISNWTDAQSAAVEADRVGGVEERKDGDIVREGGKRPAAESRGAVEGRPGGIGK
ncbi:MAG: hypothetical protein HYU98_08280 [Deltaproteobacteria bacterium]|nr:hypothetical protein [Deltaproteobacteria bacterium]